MLASANILVGGVFHAAVLFLVAAGLQIVFGVQKIVNLACGSFYALGAYFGISALAWAAAFEVPAIAYIPILVGSGLLLAIVLGPSVERLLRLIYDRDEHFQILLTFALVLIFEDAIRLIWGAVPLQTINVYFAFGELRIARDLAIPNYNLIVIASAALISGVVIAVLHGAVVEANLPVRAVFDAVGRIEIDALHLVGHAFAFEERGHDEQAVALDEAVGPAVGVGVVIGDFLQFFARDDVAEKFVDGEAEVGLLSIFGGDDAIQAFDERFGRDVFVPIKRAKIDCERRAIVRFAVLV